MNSGVLFRVARLAHERAIEVEADGRDDFSDALVSILFSMAALEAFVSELPAKAGMVRSFAQVEAGLNSLPELLDEIEEGRGSLGLKLQVCRLLLCGELFDKGIEPYQSFELLRKVRNAIVHMEPERSGESHERVVQQLVAKGLAEPRRPSVSESWLSLLRSVKVAAWACNVAADVASSLTDCASVTIGDTPVDWFMGGFERLG